MKNPKTISSVIISSAFFLSFSLVAFAYSVPTAVDVPNSAPVVSNVVLNGGSAINLTENTTTNTTTTVTVSDANGCSSITTVMADLYRSGVTAAACDTNGEDNDNNCYAQVVCTVDGGTCTGGTDTSATYSCVAPLQYYADPTDAGTYSAQNWEVTVTATDGAAATHSTTSGVELNSLSALDFGETSIEYGTLDANTDTGATNQTTTVKNTGNISIDVQLSGTVLDAGGGNIIAIANQEYSDTAFTYGAGTNLSGTPTTIVLTLPKPTSTTPVTDTILWGLGVDNGQPPGTYSGTNTFTAISD